MNGNAHLRKPAPGRRARLFFSLLLTFAIVALALAAAASQRVRLIPKFTAGETLRYQVDTRTTTSSHTTTPISNPEGGSRSSQSISLLVRLDVLHADPASKNGLPGAVRLRATYEKSQSKSQADAYDPAALSPDDPYNRLQGHSVEFTIAPDGAIADIIGLDDIFPGRSATDTIFSWAKGFSSGEAASGKSIAVGQKWSSKRALTGMPLSDLIWQSNSTYLRNEPCDPTAAAKATVTQSAGKVGESCAVILTRFQILRRGSPRSDATPTEYLHSGLRTSGKWDGSGESLDAISLVTGLVVRSTQTSAQDVDYQIASASTGSAIHQVSHSTTQSEITLVPSSPHAAQP